MTKPYWFTECKPGDKFNRWTLLHEAGIPERWFARCDCGTEREVRVRMVVAGSSRSCGCLQRDVARGSRVSNRPPTCQAPDCGGDHYSLGYCRKHYDRVRRHGSPDLPTPADRFLAQVEKGECWTWKGRRDALGYGWFSKQHSAHRFAYELLVGPIPSGMTLDHLCRNRACVKPEHLEPVTLNENQMRGFAARGHVVQAGRVLTCSRGHDLPEPSPKTGARACVICKRASERRRYREARS